jgi:phospho-N-acetylmuramoyl-pentapeptide-transferase
MLFNLLVPLADEVSVLNLFRYLTFRSGGAAMTALFISFALGPQVIVRLKRMQAHGQPIRTDGPESHVVTKAGTPTMGGVLILLALAGSTLLWADLGNRHVWIVLFVTAGFGAVGFADDYLKLTRRSHKGLPGRLRLVIEVVIALLAAAAVNLITAPPLDTGLAMPFVKEVLLPLGPFFVPFAALVMVGASNAVNLTDGLDGLAIVPVMIAAACFALIAYLAGNAVFAGYLQIHFVPGLFVLETVSVIVQVASFKLTGRRVFRMAPLHHHFEKKGWQEPTIVIRFWIIAMILAMVGLATLKVR